MFLLVLMHVVQPLMALSQADCASAAGGNERMDACCCSATPVLEQLDAVIQELSTATEQGCCSDEDAEAVLVPVQSEADGEGLHVVAADCACSMDPGPDAPLDAPAHFLPPGELGEVAFGEWLRAHAELFAGFPSGHPHLGLPPLVMDASLAANSPQEMASGAKQARLSGAISWTLVVRGVGGFLAALAVYRN